jgi:hypothetical protein
MIEPMTNHIIPNPVHSSRISQLRSPMEPFLEYLSATNPAKIAPINAPSSSKAVMMLPVSFIIKRSHPLFKPAVDVTLSSISGKSERKCGITRVMDLIVLEQSLVGNSHQALVETKCQSSHCSADRSDQGDSMCYPISRAYP